MSLINDALKRTQQATQASEPPLLGELELRPLEPAQTSLPTEGGGAKRLLWIVVLLVVTLNIALWIVFKDRGNETEVAARTTAGEVVPSEIPPSAPATPAPEVVAPEVPAEAAASSVAALEAPIELEPALIEPVAIERPEFTLKTIVSHPVRPSAMINNRVLFVGDRVEGYTVVAIGRNDVTLTLGADEVVVSLP
jgi:hypothetical protein